MNEKEEIEEVEYKIEDAELNSESKEFMIKALEDDAAWVLAYASDKLFDDKDLMLKAVTKDGQLLYYASKNLRDDKDVVLAAVSNKGIIVKYASKRLRGDKDVAMAAIKQNKKADIFLTDEIRKDEEVDAFLHPPEEKN